MEDMIHIQAVPVFRFVVKGEIIDKMDAAQQEIKTFAFYLLSNEAFPSKELVSRQCRGDNDRTSRPEEFFVPLNPINRILPISFSSLFIVPERSYCA